MLKGKIALVTGASRGIGKAIAVLLANLGATVIVNYQGSKEKAEEVVKQIADNGGEGLSYQCNISNFEASKVMVQDIINQYGRIDILVNNAGITRDNLILKMNEADFDEVISTNLKGCFNCIKHVSKNMLKQRSGRIINMSSVVALTGNVGQANYCASKAGIVGLTKAIAREFGSRGITVNAIAPGFIETEMTDVLNSTRKEQILAGIPLKRMGSVNDIAQTVAFFASDHAGYITGQVIQVDGGLGM